VHPPSTHAWFTQATGEPHSPAVHVSTPFPEHCVAFAVHAPAHAPAVHAPLAHAASPPHCPFAPHTWTSLPEHRVALGVQTPAHAPAVHT
jgi:hypothetical protein